LVSGIIEMSVLRHLHSDASLLDRSIPAIAIPTKSIRSVHEIAVCWHLDGHASLADRPIPSIALPARSVRRVHQVSVGRYPDGDAGLVDLPVPSVAFPSIAWGVQIGIRRHLDGGAGLVDLPIGSIAFPSIAGGVQIGVGGHLDGGAGFIDLSKTVTALPPASVGSICWVGIFRHLNGGAGPVDLSMASNAVPSAAMTPGACILGHPDGSALGEHNAGGSCQKCQENQGVNENGMWSSQSAHGSSRLVDAEHSTEFAVSKSDQGAGVDLGFGVNARVISTVRKRFFARLRPSNRRSRTVIFCDYDVLAFDPMMRSE
jgi:hypothetical protein